MIFVPAEATVVCLAIYHAKLNAPVEPLLFLCYVVYVTAEHPPHL
jgi:hypothetical protein